MNRIHIDTEFLLYFQANYLIETGKERKTEQMSKAVSWTGQGKRFADVISKKGKVTIKNQKKSAIKCKIEHSLQVQTVRHDHVSVF